ncbi:MAG: hypothetical protein Q4G04_03315 [bacterium]|nr:hypothetical protein [bacterium]
METYNEYNSETLIHFCPINYSMIYGILNYGILSKSIANLSEVPFSENFKGYNDEDYICLSRYYYVDPLDTESYYNIAKDNQIGFIVEGVEYISNIEDVVIHRPDEVQVKHKIAPENIKGIITSPTLLNKSLTDINVLNKKSTNYNIIINTGKNLINFFENKCNYKLSEEEQSDFKEAIYYLKCTIIALKQTPYDKELKADLKDAIQDVNTTLATISSTVISKIIGIENPTVNDLLQYISNTYNIPVYIHNIPSKNNKR